MQSHNTLGRTNSTLTSLRPSFSSGGACASSASNVHPLFSCYWTCFVYSSLNKLTLRGLGWTYWTQRIATANREFQAARLPNARPPFREIGGEAWYIHNGGDR